MPVAFSSASVPSQKFEPKSEEFLVALSVAPGQKSFRALKALGNLHNMSLPNNKDESSKASFPMISQELFGLHFQCFSYDISPRKKEQVKAMAFPLKPQLLPALNLLRFECIPYRLHKTGCQWNFCFPR